MTQTLPGRLRHRPGPDRPAEPGAEESVEA